MLFAQLSWWPDKILPTQSGLYFDLMKIRNSVAYPHAGPRQSIGQSSSPFGFNMWGPTESSVQLMANIFFFTEKC